jgi:hypothetical protein
MLTIIVVEYRAVQVVRVREDACRPVSSEEGDIRSSVDHK